MSSQVCLVCVEAIDTAGKSPQQIRIETLCKLLAPNHYKTFHASKFRDDEVCDFCEECYPLFSTMEEIRNQISLLEEQIGKKIEQIRATISEPASIQIQNNGDNNGSEKIIQIRDMILHLIGENAERHDADFESDEVQVKVEHDVNPLGDVEDQFSSHEDYNSYSQPSVDKTKDEFTDNLIDYEEEEDDSAFCIIPCAQKKRKGRPKSTNQKAPLRKRKRNDSPGPSTKSKPKIISKRIKLEATRSSSRVKRQTAPPNGVETLVVSLKRIKPAVKKSNSESSSDEDTNLNDADWVPEAEKHDIFPFSNSRVQDKNDPRGSHKCTSCPKSFIHLWSLTYHVSHYHGIPCPDPTCTATFRTVKARDSHSRKCHEGLSPYQCQICRNKFRSQNYLASHMMIQHETGEKKFSCVKCDKGFCLKENLERHLSLHEVETIKTFVCDVCDLRYVSKAKLDKHMATHNAKHRCPHCGKSNQSKKALDRHVRYRHTGEKPEKCSRCDATFANVLARQRHIIRDHSKAKSPPHICKICGKGFYLPVDLKMHQFRHDGKYQVKCDKCGETFVSAVSLRAHRIRLHGDDPFVCEECGHSFTSDIGLKLHKKIHTGDKRHKCQTCDARFIRKEELTNHMISHTAERPFPCSKCEQIFKSKKNLNVHVKRIHTPGYVTPTPHKCPHCGKGFQFPFFLEGHIRQAHTGERPFICDQCGKGFAVNSALNLHLKGAHGVVLEVKDRLPRSKKDVFRLGDDENG